MYQRISLLSRGTRNHLDSRYIPCWIIHRVIPFVPLRVSIIPKLTPNVNLKRANMPFWYPVHTLQAWTSRISMWNSIWKSYKRHFDLFLVIMLKLGPNVKLKKANMASLFDFQFNQVYSRLEHLEFLCGVPPVMAWNCMKGTLHFLNSQIHENLRFLPKNHILSLLFVVVLIFKSKKHFTTNF
jgi:hypothetical protein